MAWHVTVSDTYAESPISKSGAAAHKTAQNKMDKYAKLASTHIFYPFAMETVGTWHDMAIELTQADRRITTITEDTRETNILLFQRLSIALQTGNTASIHNTVVAE